MKQINFGKVILRVLVLLIVKPFTLPFTIYKNTLINLSNSEESDSAENTLSQDFPIYVWFMDYYDALIALIYPIGLLGLIIGVSALGEGFGSFLGGLIALYFTPLFIGLLKELFSITLKSLQYLKMINNK
jgi:hypothetical protein|tara:strand:+ start:10 stop:399 length:390 start_codon:yes stop_codon:yes gene_type:complete